MTLTLIWPAVAAALTAMALGLVRWPLRPQFAVTVFATALFAAATVTFAVTAITAIGFVLGLPLLVAVLERCSLVPSEHDIGWTIGVPAVIAATWMSMRAIRVVRTHRWAAAGSDGRAFQVIQTAEPIAYASPGRPGCVVVSSGMLDALEPEERPVMIAHERAHLLLHHHRHLLLAEVAVSVLPALRPLADQLRLAVERSADEIAVQVMGGDRRLVANAIARAALAKTAFVPTMAQFTGATVPRRVDALVGVPPLQWVIALGSTASAVAVALGLATVALQAHHLVELGLHLCGV